jgi:hypothetical protein
MVKKWIQKVVKPGEKGLLHKQLGVPQRQRIPKTLLHAIRNAETGDKIRNPTSIGKRQIKVTTLLKQRANFALNVGYGRFPRRK